ncbi:uncharacterized protein BCR38DRAFT_17279 [Pseudomassariella vexata]|uniref:Uncharacterized protein n=1 Tax=Pseudomassariella vexata TaxID=1141098 RepID=A0A1Y2EJD3_9PEZI|nr:uncharacterized protein BCR38DRAFT_17279 [Pseudomassariella vexata]ORY71661.1 hypothetical protein BCR38DRAFT_17279 [Pseudomassariella vexata]
MTRHAHQVFKTVRGFLLCPSDESRIDNSRQQSTEVDVPLLFVVIQSLSLASCFLNACLLTCGWNFRMKRQVSCGHSFSSLSPTSGISCCRNNFIPRRTSPALNFILFNGPGSASLPWELDPKSASSFATNSSSSNIITTGLKGTSPHLEQIGISIAPAFALNARK